MSPLVLGKGDVPSIAWPPIHSTKFASLAALIHQFESTQWLDRETIERGQQAQLAVLAKHHARHSESFAARLEAGGISASELDGPGWLERLPLLTRRDVQSGLGERPAFALPAGHEPSASVTTSGSTGVPVVVWKTAVNQLDWLALTMRMYRWAEGDFSGRLASVRAITLRTGSFPDWGTPISYFHRTGPMLSLAMTTDIEAQADQLLAFDPESLIIYPSNLRALMRVLERRGQRLAGLKRVRTMGETLAPQLREDVADSWGVALHDCYSSEELGYLALQCPEGACYHVQDETVLVEILDEDGRPQRAGEPGRVVVTDLRNHATPLIRYEIGDYAIRGEPCACGRGLSTLTRVMGRERNMIRNPDGTTHWPLTGFKEYRSIAPIVQYQLVQHALTELELRLVTERPLTAAEEGRLKRYILDVKLKQPFTLSLSYFEGALPTGSRGKFEEFVSMMGEGA